MKEINLLEFKQGIKGKKFSELIKYHLDRQNKSQIQLGCLGTIQMLDEKIQPHMMAFIDKWNLRANDKSFYETDCLELFEEISTDTKDLFEKMGCDADDESLFNIFQIVTLTYAYSASDQPEMRKFIGI